MIGGLSPSKSEKHKPFLDFLQSKPLPGYQKPPVYNYFNANATSPQRGQQQQRPDGLQSALTGSPLRPVTVFKRRPRPSDPVDEANRYENQNLPLNEHNRIRIVQNVTAYLRFYCGSVNHVYSLNDIEDLIAHPPMIPLDLIERFDVIWKLLNHIEDCCRVAQIRPIQWFDILTNWKPKFSRSVTATEFSLGLCRLCEEVNAPVFSQLEIDLLWDYFLRDKEQQPVEERRVRRRDWQVGFKKRAFTQKRIAWLNHQAHILFKCHAFLLRLRMTFRSLSGDVLRSRFRKQSINAIDLEHVVGILITDYIVFVNCKHVDKLLPSLSAEELAEKQRQSKAVEDEMLRRQLHSRGSAQDPRTGSNDKDGSTPLKVGSADSWDNGGTLEGVPGQADVWVLHSDDFDQMEKQSVTSQLDVGDDISTLSLWDNMSESSKDHLLQPQHYSHSAAHKHVSSKSSDHRVHLLVDAEHSLAPTAHSHGQHQKRAPFAKKSPTHTKAHFAEQPEQSHGHPHSSHHQSGSNSNVHATGMTLRDRVRNDPVRQYVKQKSSSRENIDFDEAFASHLSTEERSQLERLVENLQHRNDSFRSFESHASEESSLDSAQSGRKMSVLHGNNNASFMEERASKSFAIMRRHSMLQRYHRLSADESHAHGSDSAAHGAIGSHSHQRNPSQNSTNNTHSNDGNSGSNNLIPKEVVDDWYLRDQEYQEALKHDPSLTPAAFKEQYQQFKSNMQDLCSKQLRNYQDVSDHFDRRVFHAQQRLSRAKKTGV